MGSPDPVSSLSGAHRPESQACNSTEDALGPFVEGRFRCTEHGDFRGGGYTPVGCPLCGEDMATVTEESP